MRYTKEQISTALTLLKATGSPNKVIEILGYPSSPMLYHWRDKYPEYYQPANVRRYKHATLELKQAILKRCFIDGESVKSVSEEVGYSYSSIYGWARRYHMKGPLALMNPSSAENKTTDIVPAEDIESLKAQLLELQMEVDILKETINVLKKDPGVDQTALKNREKAVIIDALKNKYSLPSLCKKLGLPKSSYYYQEKVYLSPIIDCFDGMDQSHEQIRACTIDVKERLFPGQLSL